jgi:hypothetical protein
MGALLAIPLTLTVKELLPIFTGEPAAVQRSDVAVGVGGVTPTLPDSSSKPSAYADR